MAAERRRHERRKRRLTCQLGHEGRQLRGIVLDMSATGLFVQTSSPIPPGSRVVVELPGQAGPLEVQARVVRRRRAPQRLAALMSSGLGLELLDPPETYQELVRRHPSATPDRPAPPPSHAPELSRYRVRVTRRGSPRSRTFVLEATSELEVRSRAARELGADWDVVEIEEAC